MITLYQFPSLWGIPNASAFCMKVETFLRLMDIPYEIKSIMDPRKAPKGKLPFIKIDDKTIADSEMIIDFLKAKFGDSLDKALSAEQKAQSVVLDNCFSERLYWIMLYMRWQHEPNWFHVKEAFFAKLPSFPKLFVPKMVRKSTLKALYIQGMGRHSYDEVLEMAFKTLDAISVILGEKKYFHGDEPSSIDATALAFLANFLWVPYDDAIKMHLKNAKNIVAYCDRMRSLFYPELAEK